MRDPSKASLKTHPWESFAVTRRENTSALVGPLSHTELLSSGTTAGGRHRRRARSGRGGRFCEFSSLSREGRNQFAFPLSPPSPGEPSCLDGLRTLSFPAAPQTGTQPSKYCSSLPLLLRQGGEGHVVPRSRSSLKGSWECLWKHSGRLCQLEPLLPARLQRRREQGRPREGGERGEADVPRPRRTDGNDRTVHVDPAPLCVFQRHRNGVGGKTEREREPARPLFYHLQSTLLPDSLGKQVFTRKLRKLASGSPEQAE